MNQAAQHHQPNVVIVGAGFGGLHAARTLERAPAHITVVDRHNYHLFQPLLYQVATAALSPGDIAYPIRRTLRKQKNTEVILAEVTGIDVAGRKAILRDGELGYDYLILATGARHSYFGHPDWEPDAPALKTVDDAIEIRRRILLAFERAEREPDPARRQMLLTFVIVGGGPTGVELAGAIAEIAFKAVTDEFRNINPRDSRIILLEAGPRVLPAFPEDLSAKAEAALQRLGVDVRKGASVTDVQANNVAVGNEHISAGTIIWAAGVEASRLAASLGIPLDRAGRVPVNPDLTISGHREVFVIGDLAAFMDKNGKLLPGLAPVAIQQGRHAAKNILRALQGLPYEPFTYHDKGTLATIGRASAVADLGKVHLSGLPAWLAWLLVHIYFLIGFRNRLIVLFEWAWEYITFQRSVRLITGTDTPVKHSQPS